MLFFQSFALAALSLLASCVSAQSNPIVFPGTGDTITAGSTITIKWNPTTTGFITLTLRYGQSSNLATGPPVVVNTVNSGSYTWDVPKNIGDGNWSMEIKDSKGASNFSPMFTVTGGTGKQGNTGITSTKSFATTGTFTIIPKTSSGSAGAAATATTTGSMTGSGSTAATAAGSSPTAAGVVVKVGGQFAAAAVGLGALVALA